MMLSSSFGLHNFQDVPYFLPSVFPLGLTAVARGVEVVILNIHPIPNKQCVQLPRLLNVNFFRWESSKSDNSNLGMERARKTY